MKPPHPIAALTAVALLLAFAGCDEPISQASFRSRPRVLVVVSSSDTLRLRDGKTHPTGYYLNELIVPVRKLVDQGYEVVFADPDGNPAPMDAHSASATHFGDDVAAYESYRKFHGGLKGLRNPKRLSTVIAEGLEPFVAVFFPGGHAPMEDLSQDQDVATVLRHFHQRGKPTAMICHGPIALVSTVQDPAAFLRAIESGDTEAASKHVGDWPYAGYRMSVFSTAEEKVAEAGQLGGDVRFYPDAALEAAGGNVEIAPPWTPHVVKDRELITGQNPGSDVQLADALLKELDAGKPQPK